MSDLGNSRCFNILHICPTMMVYWYVMMQGLVHHEFVFVVELIELVLYGDILLKRILKLYFFPVNFFFKHLKGNILRRLENDRYKNHLQQNVFKAFYVNHLLNDKH